jgi:copper resistance protein B
VTAADRAAAFPDLGDMHMTAMMLEDPLNKLVLLDRLERQDDEGSPLTWDLDAWFGRTLTRVWVRSEGERRGGATERNELTVAWGKGFARWWDFVAGARRDFAPGEAETWAAVGVRGLAPYRFDIAATAFVGSAGRTAFRFESSYAILVTNRLILTPNVELDWHGNTNAPRGVGAGLGSAELGLRLRYEFRRQIAPYVGLSRERLFGRSAELAGGDGDDTRLTAGIRLWF